MTCPANFVALTLACDVDGGSRVQSIPVIALTGYLGSGKTTLLNHVLRTPGARIGVVINDFGDLNVDAALVTGQVDEPASIAGGCICCLPDEGGLDEALSKLADPRLALDAIIVEASGLADPLAISRMIRFSGVDRVRHGGVVDVIDAATHFDVVDHDGIPPARYGAASLVVVNKLDQVDDRAAVIARVENRVRERNPDAFVVGAIAGRVDPALLYDVAEHAETVGQLSFRELLIDDHHHHVHAASVTATSVGGIDPGALIDLLEQPPSGVYRLKGVVTVGYRERKRSYVVNVVGASVHVTTAPPGAPGNCLVAIGTGLDVDDVRARIDAALRPHDGPVPAAGVRRLQRYRRLSV
jgi:G3E family GTPase